MAELIKILMTGGYPLPNKPPYGGIERVVTTLVSALSQSKDLEINILSRTEAIKDDFEIEKERVKIHYFATRKPKIVSSLIRDLPALRKEIKKIDPDIIHAQDTVGAIAGIRAGYLTVMTNHGIAWKHAKFYHGLKGFGKRIIYPNLTKYALKRLEHLILINPYVEEEVKRFTGAKKYSIENPLPDKFFKIENSNRDDTIFYLGIINPRKDSFTLIKAIESIKMEIPDVRLKLVGKIGDEKYYKAMKEYVARKDMTKNIHFLGPLSDTEIEREYSAASLLCLPSRQETAPMVIAEAMAAGKPVVATNICGIPYMVDEGKNGFLFEPGDVQSLAEKIIALLRDDNLRHKMGKRAKEVARQRWSADIIAKKTMDVYTKILSREGEGLS